MRFSRCHLNTNRSVLLPASEPVAAEDLEAMIVDVPLPVAGVRFAGESPVQEASDFALAGKEVGKLIDQEVVMVAQRRALSLTRTSGGERVIQMEDMVGGGRTSHQSRPACEYPKQFGHHSLRISGAGPEAAVHPNVKRKDMTMS